jgi:hypothetical protein
MTKNSFKSHQSYSHQLPQLPVGLAVEPNQQVQQPYQYLGQRLRLQRTPSLFEALSLLDEKKFHLFMVSASFSPDKTLKLLTACKNKFVEQVIPLMIIVDLSQPLSTIPGTHWGGRLGLLHTGASRRQTLTVLDSLLSA